MTLVACMAAGIGVEVEAAAHELREGDLAGVIGREAAEVDLEVFAGLLGGDGDLGGGVERGIDVKLEPPSKPWPKLVLMAKNRKHATTKQAISTARTTRQFFMSVSCVAEIVGGEGHAAMRDVEFNFLVGGIAPDEAVHVGTAGEDIKDLPIGDQGKRLDRRVKGRQSFAHSRGRFHKQVELILHRAIDRPRQLPLAGAKSGEWKWCFLRRGVALRNPVHMRDQPREPFVHRFIEKFDQNVA